MNQDAAMVDTKVRPNQQRGGIGTELVRLAACVGRNPHAGLLHLPELETRLGAIDH